MFSAPFLEQKTGEPGEEALGTISAKQELRLVT